MIKKCLGCGAALQFKDENKDGYISRDLIDKSDICKRCFDIKNYSIYKKVDKDDSIYKDILDNIKKKNDLVLFLCDILNLDDSLNASKEFKNKIILITKWDLMPKSTKESKIKKYISDNYKIDAKDILFTSIKNNYNLDLLMSIINNKKVSENVYVVGNSNSGKSALINTLSKIYYGKDAGITTSMAPNTTLNTVEIKVSTDLTFIDTPGINDDVNYLSVIDGKYFKKVVPKEKIRPITYQLRPNESLVVDKYLRIDYNGPDVNSFTFYISNNLKIRKANFKKDYLKDLDKKSFNIESGSDIVIKGFCFIKIVKTADVDIYLDKDVTIYIRKNLI